MQKLGTAKTIRFEDYLIISLSGKWEQAFGRLPEFEVKLDSNGRMHLVSTTPVHKIDTV